MGDLKQELRDALIHHHAGRIKEAEQLYRKILTADPNYAEAWQCLAALAHQAGQFEPAVQMLERALKLGLHTPETFNNLGEALRCLDKVQEAANAYKQALQLNPRYAEALGNLGLLYNSQEQFVDAIPLLEKAITLQPKLANAHLNYGIALANLGKLELAIKHWEISLRLNPDHVFALKNLGIALQQMERFEESAKILQRMVEIDPNFAEGRAYYGHALVCAGKIDEGIAQGRKAIEQVPREQPQLHNILAMIYFRAERWDDALMAAKKAVRLDPGFFNAIVNVGRVYAKLENHAEAMAWFQRASEINRADPNVGKALFVASYQLKRYDKALEAADLTLQYNPDDPDVHFNKSTALLTLGRYLEGFQEYDWRDGHKSFNTLLKNMNKSSWDGSDPAGQSVLICSEQGFGDIIQFARYIPMVVAKGARVMVDVPWEVRPLVETIPGIIRVVPMETKLSEFNLHVLLLSLPRIFGTTLDTIPTNIPYFHADALRIERWKPPIDSHARGLKVGIVWGGNSKPDPRRSCSLKEMSILADVPDVSWFSLQVGEPREQLKDAPQMRLLDLGKDFKDFGDTAAVMKQMDLIITIDTSAAHLAGALGLKTWIMLPYSADWRWMTEGETTPWYPTARLFRQRQLDEWGPVIQQIGDELTALVESRR